MSGRGLRPVGVMAGVLWLSVTLPAFSESSRAWADRSVRFELAEDLGTGLLPPGRQVKLHVQLAGEAAGAGGDRIVAVLEGAGMARTLVPMAPDREPGSWQATAWLELPALPARTSPAAPLDGVAGTPPQVVRITVAFARVRGMTMGRFAERRVYVTVGGEADDARTGRAAPLEQVGTHAAAAGVFTGMDSEVPSGPGIKDEALVEQDLMAGSPRAEDFQIYWKEIRRHITQRWGERARAALRESPNKYPRVRFRLYPNGVAQTIYLERSSGNPRVDEAGLESVVDVQPFSPFPGTLDDPYVNVYVDFRPEGRNR